MRLAGAEVVSRPNSVNRLCGQTVLSTLIEPKRVSGGLANHGRPEPPPKRNRPAEEQAGVETSRKKRANASGIDTYSNAARVASKILPLHGRMMRRRGELIRLAHHRRRHGIDVGSPAAWAIVAADALTFGWHGMDFLTFSKVAKDAGVAFPEEIAMAAIHKVAARAERKGKDYRPFHAMAVARMLDVTAEERWACQIRTIGAVDESRQEREERRKEDRRAYERERSRRRRTAAGAMQRPIYEARSSAQIKPWEALGMSRATWYRRGKPAATACEKAVRQVRPLTYTFSYDGRSQPVSPASIVRAEPGSSAARLPAAPFRSTGCGSGNAGAGHWWEEGPGQLERYRPPPWDRFGMRWNGPQCPMDDHQRALAAIGAHHWQTRASQRPAMRRAA